MTTTTTAPSDTRCPPWCTKDVRGGEYAGGPATWHHSGPRLIEVARKPDHFGLSVELTLFDPAPDEAAAPALQIEVGGDDGSGFECGLMLPIDSAEQTALAMLELVKAARA